MYPNKFEGYAYVAELYVRETFGQERLDACYESVKWVRASDHAHRVECDCFTSANSSFSIGVWYTPCNPSWSAFKASLDVWHKKAVEIERTYLASKPKVAWKAPWVG